MVAACVDELEDAKKVAEGLTFPVAWGVTREVAERLGAFWDDRRSFIQPAEFILGGGGRVLASSYSSGPVGRIDPADAVSLLKLMEQKRREKEQS